MDGFARIVESRSVEESTRSEEVFSSCGDLGSPSIVPSSLRKDSISY